MFVIGVLIVPALTAQGAPTTPTLTDVQKLQIQALLQARVISELKAELAKKDYDAATNALVQLARALQIEGFTLDLNTLTFAPNPRPAPPETTTK